jgi:DNA-binding response OmpR family regulator
MRILVVDDESEIRNVVKLLLVNKGYEVVEAKNGEEAVAAVSSDKEIDLCIMDIMMPGMSGIEATRQIRSFSNVPVLFLTARSMDADKSSAYDAGGDDYLVKPFSSRELLMKVDALTRRYNSYGIKKDGKDHIHLRGGVSVCCSTREVMKHDTLVDMRDREIEVLIYLAQNRGRVVSPSELYENVWGEMSLPSSNNTVTVHILNLRRKLEDDPADPKLIRTVWGRGYQID